MAHTLSTETVWAPARPKWQAGPVQLHKGHPMINFMTEDILGQSVCTGKLKGRPALLAFYSSTGSTLVQSRLKELHALALRHPELAILVVFHESATAVAQVAMRFAYPFSFIADQSGVLFSKYRIARATAAQRLSGLMKPGRWMKALNQGIRPAYSSHHFSCMSGEFLVTPSQIIRCVHYGKDPSDFLPIQQIDGLLA